VADPGAAPREALEAKIERLVFGVNVLSIEYSVMRHGSQTQSIQYRPEYEHLVALDPNTGQTIPELATEWSLEPDGLSFRFKLRKGVQFHRGWGEFTAKDVVHTHEQLVLPDSEHAQAFSWARDVADVEVVNDYEVIFRLNTPDANFLSKLGEQQSMMPIQSKANFDAEGEPPHPESLYIAGTGPYQMQSRTIASFIRFERPAGAHWRITPDFEEFEYKFVGEPSTRLAGLLAGEMQIADIPKDLQPQATGKGMNIANGNVPGLRTWVNISCCWTDPETGAYPARPDSPLTDVRVRKALSKSINRPLLNEAFFRNTASPMYMNHFHPTRLAWNTEWETRFPEAHGFDPVAARAILAEAGYNANNPLETNIDITELPHYAGAADVGEGIAGMWADVGVKVNILTRESAIRRAARRAFKDANHLVVSASSSDHFFGFAVWTTPIFSQTNANNIPAINDLTRKGMQTLEPQAQFDVWREIGNMYYDAYLTLPLFWLPAEAVYNPEFISDYVFPGSITGTWTHIQNIRAAQ
jgi:ABC-type transport system substrate-binding protein